MNPKLKEVIQRHENAIKAKSVIYSEIEKHKNIKLADYFYFEFEFDILVHWLQVVDTVLSKVEAPESVSCYHLNVYRAFMSKDLPDLLKEAGRNAFNSRMTTYEYMLLKHGPREILSWFSRYLGKEFETNTFLEGVEVEPTLEGLVIEGILQEELNNLGYGKQMKLLV